VDIGIVMAVRNHPDRPYPLTEVYEDYVADGVHAERLGFDHVWIGEHRMTPCQWTPSPVAVMTAIAARTERIRIGSSVMCLPFHNPLRIAEDFAVMDQLSRGRIDLGFGVGSQYEEYRTFGVDVAERFGMTYEAAALIRRCFDTRDTFSWEGRHYRFPEITFTTPPAQERMPFYASAIGPQSVALAARRGYHLISMRQPGYDEALRSAGRDPADHRAIPLQMVHVAETTERAWEEALEGLHYFANFYTLRRRPDGSLPDPAEAEISRERIRAGSLGMLGTAAVGTPDEVTATLRGVLRAFPGTSGFALGFRHAGMRTPEVRRSMDLFAREVLPNLRP